MIERSFHTPAPLGLLLSLPVGRIEVETVDGEETHVVVEGPDKVLEQIRVDLRERLGGRQVVVEFEQTRLFGINISIGNLTFGSGDLRVTVRCPHGADAEIKTASADVDLRGRFGALDAKTASGDVDARGEVERDAAVKTVSGDVRLGRVGGDLRAQTVSADIEVEAVGGSVESKTVSGDVHVGSVREGKATLQSVSGDLAVGIAPGSAIDVDANSVSGDLSSEVPLSSEPGGSDGPTVVVRGKTVSGDFRVFRAA